MADEKAPAPVTDTEKRTEKQVDPKPENHAHDADEAMKVIDELNGESATIDRETNKRLLRRIDLHLMPIMCLVYGMNYFSQTILSYASMMGLKSDLNPKGYDYQWLVCSFYFGYLAGEYPTNRLLQRLPLGKYSAACIVIWGLTLSCFAAVENLSGAVAIRFFLGVFEASVMPGFALLTSQWYTKDEQGSRVNLWFSFSGWGQVLGRLVAYGISKGSEESGSSIAPWKTVFLWAGLLTIVLGFTFLRIIPDNQLNARWLKREERTLAVSRVKVNQQGIGNKHFKLYQTKEALLDPMTWIFFFYAMIAHIANGGIANLFSKLVRSSGFTEQRGLLYGVPGDVVEAIALLLNGYVGAKTQQRLLTSLGGLFFATVGMLLFDILPLSNNVGQLIGYYLTRASRTPFVTLLSLISSNVAGYTKKTTVVAIYLIGYRLGSMMGPQTVDGSRFMSAENMTIVCWSACPIIVACIWRRYRSENKRKAKIRASPDYVRLENQEWLDLTDRENHDFVYSL